jgi:hypothetical protein
VSFLVFLNTLPERSLQGPVRKMGNTVGAPMFRKKNGEGLITKRSRTERGKCTEQSAPMRTCDGPKGKTKEETTKKPLPTSGAHLIIPRRSASVVHLLLSQQRLDILD